MAISDCQALSTSEPNRNILGELIVCPKDLSILDTKVILTIVSHFLSNIEYSQGVWMCLFLEIVIVSI